MQTIMDIKNRYWEAWEHYKDQRHDLKTSWQLLDRLTRIADETVIGVVNEMPVPPRDIAIIALGGYARAHMSPHSDIDLLLLHKRRVKPDQKEFIHAFTTALWDVGVNPGIQVKQMSEIEQAAFDDEVVRTSLIDNRLLAGDEKVFEQFRKIINNKILERGTGEFLMTKIGNVRERSKKFRDSIYRLEPNLKEGEGGVRDFNTISWICKILFKTDNLVELIRNDILETEEYDELIRRVEFIFRIRNEIHYAHNRKYDVLSVDVQKQISEEFGYLSTSNILGVEIFMRDYYFAAREVSSITRKVINRTLTERALKKQRKTRVYTAEVADGFIQYGNKLTIRSAELFAESPKRLLMVFYHAAKRGLVISDGTYDEVTKHLYLVDEAYRKKYGPLFLKLVGMFPNAADNASRMLKAGLLQAFVPEFEELVCKAQFDMYHHYTVDEHTIIALSYIDKLVGSVPPTRTAYQQALQRIKRKEILAFAILLHDIGKGQGKNHSIVGSKMSRIICRRLGMSMDNIDTVSNLVEHHLLMSHIAQRRDLHSIEVIEHFTSFLNNEDELDLLYLLTYADMSAVGGTTFNQWRNSLLTELHIKSRLSFENENMEQEYNSVVARRRAKLKERAAGSEAQTILVESLDDDFIFSNNTKHLLRYITLATSVNTGHPVLVEMERREDLSGIEITVCTYDFIGLLRKLSGGLASLGLNILWAQIATFTNGVAVDTILVSNPFDDDELFEEKMPQIRKRITDTILGHVDVEEKIASAAAGVMKKKKIQPVKSKVVFDNEVSSSYTVIDVYTEDKLGLLHDVLMVFERLGLDVEKAKISTDVDRVVDSFYLNDNKDQKITDPETLDKIRIELLKEIDD